MKILITGHKGFIGSHFYKKMIEMGFDVTGIDILDGFDCFSFFKTCSNVYDFVFHFACYVEPSISLKNVKQSNVGYDLSIDSSLFSWALHTKQKNIVYFSSSCVYPICLQNDPNYKLKESDVSFDIIRKPDSIYGWTKLTGEYLANYVKDQGINVYIFRPFSIYGEDQNPTFVFKRYLDLAMRKEKKITIWGDGEQTRDFIYIDDVVDSVMMCVLEGIQTPMNIGNGEGVSINSIIKILSNELNWTPNIEYLTDMEIGSQYKCADCKKLNNFYETKYTMRDVIKKLKGNF